MTYRWVLPKLDFLEARKSVWPKSNLAHPVIFSLVYMEKLPRQKIWLNQESSLTDVWLMWDPPVYGTLHVFYSLYSSFLFIKLNKKPCFKS